jgi:hypothetical protein
MSHRRGTSGTIVSALLAILVLPYAAPAICGVMGRMRADTSEMPAGCTVSAGASATTDSWNAVTPINGHCRFEQCGATVVAPVALALTEVPVALDVQLELPAPASPSIDSSISPPTPPPQA